jgi:hypothetical protein
MAAVAFSWHSRDFEWQRQYCHPVQWLAHMRFVRVWPEITIIYESLASVVAALQMRVVVVW